MLEEYIKQRLQEKRILLMTHIVMGYPSFEDSFKIVESMVTAGVDLMELQIPFSEPIADGPVILAANQKALENGATVHRCLQFAQEVVAAFDIPFLFMTYYNVVFKRGEERFFAEAREAGIRGAIVPDIPPEEGESYMAAAAANHIDPIFIFSPTSSSERLTYLARFGNGFFYCVARKGVTGAKTSFDQEFTDYISRCKNATELPLAVGFGISSKDDIAMLKGRADIAVIGTATIKLVEEHGEDAVGPFIAGLK